MLADASFDMSAFNLANLDAMPDLVGDYDSSSENIFQSRQSIKHRFPGLEGNLLWKVITQHYVVNMAYPIKFFDRHARKLCFRSSHNDRDDGPARTKYKRSLATNGFNAEARSKAVAMCRDDGGWDILAAAHCVEAVYELWEDGCRTPQLLQSIKDGLADCILVRSDCPADVLRWIVLHFNKHNGGIGYSMNQAMNDHAKLETDFQNFKDSQTPKITVSSIGGSGAHEQYKRQWLRNHSKSDEFGSRWEYFDKLGTFIKQTEESGRLEEFKKYLSTSVGQPTKSSVDLETMARNMAKLDSLMRTKYHSTLSEERFELCWWELVKCCLPPAHPDQDEQMLLDSLLPPELSHIATPMNNGKKVRVKVKSVKNAKTSSVKAKVKALAKPKAAKAGKNKLKKDANKTSSDAKENNNDTNTEGGKESEIKEKESEKDSEKDSQKEDKVENYQVFQQSSSVMKSMEWIEDFSWVVDQAALFLSASGHVVDKVMKDEVSHCLRRSLRLIFTKRTTFEGTDFTVWSHLKKAILKFLVEKSKLWLEQHKVEVAARSAAAPQGQAVQQGPDEVDLIGFRDFIVEWLDSGHTTTSVHMKPRFRRALEKFRDLTFKGCGQDDPGTALSLLLSPIYSSLSHSDPIPKC